VVLDELRMVEDGGSFAVKLEPGTYKLELTSHAEVSIAWIGASCPGTNTAKTFSNICEMAATGQLVIKNPTLLGLGPTASVTAKMTRLAR
jgi:hypothetical protein